VGPLSSPLDILTCLRFACGDKIRFIWLLALGGTPPEQLNRYAADHQLNACFGFAVVITGGTTYITIQACASIHFANAPPPFASRKTCTFLSVAACCKGAYKYINDVLFSKIKDAGRTRPDSQCRSLQLQQHGI
jgi:hypothetical protein